jgi:hypothetical protein
MDLEIVRIYAQNVGNIPRVSHIVYMEDLSSHVRKKGLRRAVKVWIGKADKVGCALSHTCSSTDGSNNSIAAPAINTKSK